jgi:hypothetical protein
MIVADTKALTLAGLEKEEELASLCDDKLALTISGTFGGKGAKPKVSGNGPR